VDAQVDAFAVHAGFMVGKVALGQVLLQILWFSSTDVILWFSSINIIPLLLHNYSGVI
jgi:hypothetical protein